jgi:hypothetical protein
LLGDGAGNRESWIGNRLEELAEISRADQKHGPTLSPWKSLDFGGAGRDLRAAGFERPALEAGMKKLRGDRLLGPLFAASCVKLREIAVWIGVRHQVNPTGCPIRSYDHESSIASNSRDLVAALERGSRSAHAANPMKT